MKKPTVGKLKGVFALLSVPMGFCLVPIGRQVEPGRLRRQMDTALRNLQATDPWLVGSASWDCARGVVVTAFCNICGLPSYTSTPEMYRFREDLDRKLRGIVDLDTLSRIGSRPGQTGPLGRGDADRRRPLFDQCIPPGQ